LRLLAGRGLGVSCGRTGRDGWIVMGEAGAAADALTVQVLADPEDDEQLLHELTGLLQEELLELDVAAVEPIAGEAQEGTKGVVADIVGWLLVHVGPAGLDAVANCVVAWVGRSRRSVELSIGGDTLKLTGATRPQMDRALDEWLARHPSSA
jgi:hypothetical protein